MVKKQVLDTIRNNHLIEKDAHIVLGLSGGPDSVCLFYVLADLAEDWNWTIHPVHVNHGFRPGAAEVDQAYAEKIAGELGFPCRSFTVDCGALAEAEHMTAEEAGRKARYDAFAETAESLRAEGIPEENICIAVAQNADDQAETILFRILRGTGIDGLAGILRERRDPAGNRIVRPLLEVRREDILAYCKARGLEPRMDHTNEEPVYTRNKIRLRLLPYLEQEYNPSVKDTMIRLGKAAESDRDCLWQQALTSYEKIALCREENSILLDGVALRECHSAIRRRVLAKAFSDLGLSEDLTAAHFENCETIVFHPAPSAKCDLPKGFFLTKVYDQIKAGRTDGAAGPKLPRIQVKLLTAEEYRQLQLPKDRYAAFDFDLFTKTLGNDAAERLCIDRRRAGDVIPIGENRSKKIQDFFVDQKIPREARGHIPLLKVGREVLWVLPAFGKGRFTAKYRVSEATKKVICIEIICEI